MASRYEEATRVLKERLDDLGEIINEAEQPKADPNRVHELVRQWQVIATRELGRVIGPGARQWFGDTWRDFREPNSHQDIGDLLTAYVHHLTILHDNFHKNPEAVLEVVPGVVVDEEQLPNLDLGSPKESTEQPTEGKWEDPRHKRALQTAKGGLKSLTDLMSNTELREGQPTKHHEALKQWAEITARQLGKTVGMGHRVWLEREWKNYCPNPRGGPRFPVEALETILTEHLEVLLDNLETNPEGVITVKHPKGIKLKPLQPVSNSSVEPFDIRDKNPAWIFKHMTCASWLFLLSVVGVLIAAAFYFGAWARHEEWEFFKKLPWFPEF